MLGRSGTPVASWFMNEADLLVVFGASFSDHTGITAAKPIIQADFDRMALGKHHGVDGPIWGDIALTTAALRERLPAMRSCTDQRGELAGAGACGVSRKRGAKTKTTAPASIRRSCSVISSAAIPSDKIDLRL